MPNIRVTPLDERGPLHEGRTGSAAYTSIKGCECGYCLYKRADKRARDAAEREVRNRKAPTVRSAMTPEQTQEARERLIYLHETLGLALDSIGRLSGIADSGIGRIIKPTRAGAITGTITYTTYTRIMAIDLSTAVADAKALCPVRGTMIPNTASVRMVRALQYNGFGLKAQSRIGALSTDTLKYISGAQRPMVVFETDQKIRSLYARLAYAHPGTGRAVDYAKAHARRKGWAPPACWDDDTIGDPEAIAQWTGSCGYLKGYRLHLEREIPMCEPCRAKAPRDGA